MCDTSKTPPPAGEFLLVYVTSPSRENAETLARALVGERLAAGANLLEGMRSVYRWQGRIEEADEVLCLFKTTENRRERLFSRVRELHPYEVPCIVSLPVTAGHAPFLEWIAAETQAEE